MHNEYRWSRLKAGSRKIPLKLKASNFSVFTKSTAPLLFLGLAFITLIKSPLLGQSLRDSTEIYDSKVQLRAAIGEADTPLVLNYCSQLFEAGQALNKPALVGEALFFRAYVNKNLDVASNIYRQALEFFDTATDKIWHLHINANLGYNHQTQGYFQLGLMYYQRAYEFAVALNDTFYIADKLGSLSVNCSDIENFDRGIYYAQEGLKWAAQVGDIENRQFLTAKLYNALGINYDLKGDYEQALAAHKKNLEINVEKEYFARGTIYNNIGNTYSKLGQWKEAAQYWVKAQPTMQNDPYSRSTIELNLGRLYLYQQQWDAAKIHITAALDAAYECHSYEKIRDALEQKSRYFEAVGDYKTALSFNRQYIQLRDSLLNEAKLRALTEADIQFDARTKNEQNLLLSKQNAEQQLLIEKRNNQLLWAAFGGTLMLLIFAVLWYINRLNKKQKNLKAAQQLQQARFSAVMETEDKERQRIAAELHDGLGQVLTSARLNAAALEGEVQPEDEPLLQNTLELLDRSIQEVRSISHNMMPTALTTLGLLPALREVVQKNNVAHPTQIAADFDCLEGYVFNELAERTLYRSVQELLNNTLKHAQATAINIQISWEQENLLVVFSDNGIGFDTAALKKTTGLGWANISTRLAWLGGTIHTNSEKGQGTQTTIRIPKNACLA